MKKVSKQEFLLTGNNLQKPITGDITYQPNGKPKPLVIFLHGFKGFKDWGPWHLLAKQYAEEGFCFCKFNFSHNGIVPENLTDITDAEAFGYNNFSKEMEDADRILDFLGEEENLKAFEINPSHIYLIGHSRGGGLGIIKAYEDPRIKKIATWASVHDFAGRFSTHELDYWKKNEVIFAKNSRTGAEYPMYYQFVEDFLASKDRFFIQKAIENTHKPILIVHGTKDETVHVKAAFALHEWQPESTLFILPEANHVFGAKHPYEDESLPKMMTKVNKRTIAFFKER